MFVSLIEKDSHQIGAANVPTDTPPVVGLSIIQGGMAAEVAEENELDQANNYYKHQAYIFRFIHQNYVFFETAKFGIFSYTDISLYVCTPQQHGSRKDTRIIDMHVLHVLSFFSQLTSSRIDLIR